ncbi:dynein heavy chain, outer arm [Thraustotheca clavata]|uniref:Dynein heavy chain, cytoplasmic n=1 Tax=Thraustotheca clavata TaxID=74557 RepID=A0A1W0A473_9STRA|nr:dynein heavy chain, outer arm [Thraustotheca clavata]
MAFQARHRWIIQKLHLCLGFKDEGQVEELMKTNGIMDALTAFFAPTGPSKVFFYYQIRHYEMDNEANASDNASEASSPSPQGKDERDNPHEPELFVTDGETEPLLARAVYILKKHKAPKPSIVRLLQNTKASLVEAALSEEMIQLTTINPAVANDGMLEYGVLDKSILVTMEALFSQLYLPLLHERNECEWGEADVESKNEFLHGMRSFITDLQGSLKTMSAGLELRKPDKRYDPNDSRNLSRLAADECAVVHFVDLIQDWCRQTEAYLDDSDQTRWESSESGPDTELEYWKGRLQRLTGITEQLKTKECKMVIGVLTMVTKQHDVGLDKQSVFSLLRQWKQIDINITEATNEAKDNVKYLATLEKFIEPLYFGTPNAVIDALPALMNAVKMIHTIARYYNTTERMTKLFMKITNQMIVLCKNSINGNDPPDYIWNKNPEKLLDSLETCLRLNEAYQEQYRLTKDKLLTMPKGKQFDFSETQIFGKFDLFCRRIIRLIDMFSTIHQFQSLADHSLEGMSELIETFQKIIAEFKLNKHDLLDYQNNKFDRDYVEFNVRISDLELSFQHFINQSFESITSIEQSLNMLKQFQTILQRENLRNDLDSKFTVIFHNYGLDLTTVQEIYEKHRHDPPIARNLTPVAGNILWSRHLLRRIEEPMRKFESNPSVLATKDSKKVIKTYNKVARTLVAFEYLWYEAWCRSIDTAKGGLHATLIIRHPQTNKLYVNFDKEILQLIREAKCLNRMGIEIPENAKMVMLQEDKFKNYYNELTYTLREYDRVTSKIIPITENLLKPHLDDIQTKIRPGMVTLTWTSMNIDAYKVQVHLGLQRLEELINSVNDMIENRVEKNLKVVSKAVLVILPTNQSFALDDFVRAQEKNVSAVTTMLSAKNTEVENAVEDVLRLISEFTVDSPEVKTKSLDSSSSSVALPNLVNLPEHSLDTENQEAFRTHYKTLMYRALLNCTKSSLNAIKKRVCSKAGTGFLFLERPFFEVDVQLSVPSVRLSPSLEDIQRAINRSAVAVLKCSKSLYTWGQQEVFPETSRVTFFDRLGCDTEIIKVALLLTGALHGTKNQVHEYLSNFKKYDWLWKEDMEFRYNQFIKRNPTIQDFENELKNFMVVEAEINSIAPVHNIAALSLNTKNLKLQLRNECRQWKVQYSDRVHQQARLALTNLMDYMRITNTKLNRDVESLDALRFVMMVLKEVRERESTIEMEINPILDMYDMLEHFLPGGYMDKEEMDQKSVIRSTWRKLVDYAEEVTDNLSEVQGKFKKQLTKDVKEFQSDVVQFRTDYNNNGPMVSGIKPTEAVERLARFKEMLALRDRKLEIYSAGEELFGMRPTEYPELTKSRKELALLDQLYGLYMDVVQTMEGYRNILWSAVPGALEDMNTSITVFDERCKRMPRKLCEWEAYRLLRKEISDFVDVLPIIRELSKDCIKPRHWQDIVNTTGVTLAFDSDTFRLKDLLDAHLLQNKDEIEYICDSAQKQLQIEIKLKDLKEVWAAATFEFGEWKSRGIPVLKGFVVVIEELEEAQLQLQGMLSLRHVVPFRDLVQAKLTQLSETADVLELWVKVQTLWMSLESVFTGGDIAKQMPVEAKKFAKIDKDWIKIMTKANETGNVVAACANEALKSTLPILFGELEKCQKSLEGYLEQKRMKFPRFYFVSNPFLLQVLSRGSDPHLVQQYYEKIFDSVDQVVHDKQDKRKITHLKSIVGNDEEIIVMTKHVLAEGNIEDWLCALEKEMFATMKSLCRDTASDCVNLSLREFVTKTCGQFALLGIQLLWTAQSQEALQKCKSVKGIMSDTSKKQVMLLSELSSWCLTDLGTKLNRIKIETLITIQVHQRDCFADLARLFKDRKISDASDFEWLKQARLYWRVNPVSDRLGPDACVISICDVDFKYAYEYLGCKERLVITPLTDRCYITLSQALGMYLGGSPTGPAGTGKTETVKDLGRTLGTYVVVTNCTDQQRFMDMAKIFKGLCQAGFWGCFDEFNRIELPVLSVVAQQILAITNAKRVQACTFIFPGDTQVIPLNIDVGYFITMNPGYQGRQELPENLKALFRGVAMMVPDREIIIKVKLCSVGYDSFSDLARKFKTLYGLCEEQLSKQKHYDFGLRNILSVLRTAGQTKRANLDANEEALLMRTLRDMNVSKLVAQDTPLFLSLLKDIFPSVDTPTASSQHTVVQQIVIDVLVSQNKIAHPPWTLKVIQLYETTLVRHGIMVVGPAGTGKSEMFKTLQSALTTHLKIPHRQVRMNPKAIRPEEMFGETDKISGEWLDGVFASIWSKYNDRTRRDISWIVCDGPVDAIWIENLNTVLDDNKLLTLANGDRIPMTDNCKLMFEVEDLRNASPATVSRAGIIYVSEVDLDWSPLVEGWLHTISENQRPILRALFHKFVGESTPQSPGHLFKFLGRACRPVLYCSRSGMMESCLHLLSSVLNCAELSDNSDMEIEIERLFLFSLAWAVGGLYEQDDRIRLNDYLADMTKCFFQKQAKATVFDFVVNSTTLEWERWNLEPWDGPGSLIDLDISSIVIPTVETTRCLYLLQQVNAKRPVLLVGGNGTGKTAAAQLYFDRLDPEYMMVKKIIFSSVSLPGAFQQTLEADLDKRGGKNFGPSHGRKMTLFLDDISMPECNAWGDQPTLEIVRQLMETGGLCFLDKDKRGDVKVIEDLFYVAAMPHAKEGKNDIPNRLKRHFFAFNLIVPTLDVIDAIYGQVIKWRAGFLDTKKDKSIIEVTSKLTSTTIHIWSFMRKTMLPTPQKFHYIFTMRDLARIFQGILRGFEMVTSDRYLVKLWRHECERLFADRLTTLDDKAKLRDELNTTTDNLLLKPVVPPGKDKSSKEVVVQDQSNVPTFFVDFMRDDKRDDDGILIEEAPKLYECVPTMTVVRTRMEFLLDAFNRENPSRKMSLILFDDALLHVLRIVRGLGLPKSHLMLVGVGGSGKQSLTKLAAVLARMQLFQITVTKAYNTSLFLEDWRQLFKWTGQQNKGVVFLCTDNEIKDDSFLEILNSVLATGEIPNLFPKDEMSFLVSDLRSALLKAHPNINDSVENLTKFFFQRVKSNLHIVLSMSPVDRRFSERCRKFPALVSGSTVDWYLAWPQEALVAVSKGYLEDFPIECTATVKDQLIGHMGWLHDTVVDVCTEYFDKRRRNVYQTPKSYLSFLEFYKMLYKTKIQEIHKSESSINTGLQKLIQGAADVEKMKGVLKGEEAKLIQAEQAANTMLENLQVKSMEAKKENDIVTKIKEHCERDASIIQREKEDAEEDLAKAQPFLDEAERAVSSIKPNDLNELKKLAKPGDIIKLIFDGVALLQMYPLVRVEKAQVTLNKKSVDFILDSYASVKQGMLSDTRFLQNVFHFSKYEKDNINDETIELLQPYLDLEGFSPAAAKNASKAAEGLCTWVIAMTKYHHASKVVKPKLETLRVAEGRLEAAQADLKQAQEKLVACQSVLQSLQDDFELQMAEKARVEENASTTRKKMEQATALIQGLAGEKKRWTEESNRFADRKLRLVGDCAVASAFVSYCGPFNKDYRDILCKVKFTKDLKDRQVPVAADLQLTSFLVDLGTVSDWNLEGLPADPLSIQNGILVTMSTKYPLLIDPQGQGLNWITAREAGKLSPLGILTMNHPKLRDQLEFCVTEGKVLIIEGLEQEIDPSMHSVLEKNIIVKAKSKYVMVADKLCEFSDSFMLYMTTRLPNPHFAPEVQAKTMLVDFTVTQEGLEDQLLAKVIQTEQKSLEEQLNRVQIDVNTNTKALLALDALLLERLASNAGNLLDDIELIGVLASTKAKATEVNDKLVAAADMKLGIDEKREQYRPVATRGSVLYFSLVDLSLVNSMYQTSLDQFLTLFKKAMEVAERATLTSKRVAHIVETMTYLVYRFINRGIYEKDKLAFVLMITFKVFVTAEIMDPGDISLFIKAGANRNAQGEKPKPYNWMSQAAWLNILQLSQEKAVFKNLPVDIERSENAWRRWYEDNAPEMAIVPEYENVMFHPSSADCTTHFLRLLLIRCLREDRTILATLEFIKLVESIDVKSKETGAMVKLPCMGPRYVEAVTDTVESIWSEMTMDTPVIYLLSLGSDPTEAIETLARKKRQPIQSISMGEGQEIIAGKAMANAMLNGSWVLLQNCHLGLAFMEAIPEILSKSKETSNPDFRLFLTSEPHPSFSITLLQKSIKVTNEPPSGLRAGLLRSYTVLIDQDKLERIETAQWRALLFTICFLHSIVQERRKFGPLGFSIPYEFNASDLIASITFLEKHLYSNGTPSWQTIQYMIAEVHYGGRITDELDRRLFKTYCDEWFNTSTLAPSFSFNPESLVGHIPNDYVYVVPEVVELDDYHRVLNTFPKVDSPEIFGLHPNADLTFRVKEVSSLLHTLADTQPKQQSSKNGRTREDVVLDKCDEFKDRLPKDFVDEVCMDLISQKLGGFQVPMNVFLMQEIQRLQQLLVVVRKVIIETQGAIKGELVVTPDISSTIHAMFDAKVPPLWLHRDISWSAPSLGVWFAGLLDRHKQLEHWIEKQKPFTFWLTGFFNPQGFLTAMRQEVTRHHVHDKWALDDVVYHTEVTEYERLEQIRQSPKEGVLVHGLFLEGGGWNKANATLVESEPKRLFSPLPVLFVTATTKAQKKSRSGDYGPYGGFECPVYKYPSRTDRNVIFLVTLASRDHRPLHWVLRGVALLCTTE